MEMLNDPLVVASTGAVVSVISKFGALSSIGTARMLSISSVSSCKL